MADDSDGPQGQGAYRRLLQDIRAGSLPPGTRLRETELAERLGISRTPVREAIRQLEADGLVIHLPRQGATVRSLDYAEVIELTKCAPCWKAPPPGWPPAPPRRWSCQSWRR